jgi:hypothetical protein
MYQDVDAHSVVRRRDSHIFQTIGSQMAVRWALSAGRSPRKTPATHFW